MQNFLSTFFIISFAISVMVINTNLSTYSRTAKYVKEDLEIAVHDASLKIDQNAYSKGQLVINPTEAQQAFIDSLKANAGLNTGDYQILEFKIFDDSNTTFPVNYSLNNSNFTETIDSPTVVAAIEVQSNKYFKIFKSQPVSRVASYSYKIKNVNGVSNVQITSPSSQGFVWAVPYTTSITQPFTPEQINPTTGQINWHKGIDISSSGVFGKPVVSVKDGKVTYAGSMTGYGNMVEVTHSNGLVTRYGNLNSIGVTNGQSVTQGQVLGAVGSSGESSDPHLHFETILNGVYLDPVQFYK